MGKMLKNKIIGWREKVIRDIFFVSNVDNVFNHKLSRNFLGRRCGNDYKLLRTDFICKYLLIWAYCNWTVFNMSAIFKVKFSIKSSYCTTAHILRVVVDNKIEEKLVTCFDYLFTAQSCFVSKLAKTGPEKFILERIFFKSGRAS